MWSLATLTHKEYQIVDLNSRLDLLTPHLCEYVKFFNHSQGLTYSTATTAATTISDSTNANAASIGTAINICTSNSITAISAPLSSISTTLGFPPSITNSLHPIRTDVTSFNDNLGCTYSLASGKGTNRGTGISNLPCLPNGGMRSGNQSYHATGSVRLTEASLTPDPLAYYCPFGNASGSGFISPEFISENSNEELTFVASDPNVLAGLQTHLHQQPFLQQTAHNLLQQVQPQTHLLHSQQQDHQQYRLAGQTVNSLTCNTSLSPALSFAIRSTNNSFSGQPVPNIGNRPLVGNARVGIDAGSDSLFTSTSTFSDYKASSSTSVNDALVMPSSTGLKNSDYLMLLPQTAHSPSPGSPNVSGLINDDFSGSLSFDDPGFLRSGQVGLNLLPNQATPKANLHYYHHHQQANLQYQHQQQMGRISTFSSEPLLEESHESRDLFSSLSPTVAPSHGSICFPASGSCSNDSDKHKPATESTLPGILEPGSHEVLSIPGSRDFKTESCHILSPGVPTTSYLTNESATIFTSLTGSNRCAVSIASSCAVKLPECTSPNVSLSSGFSNQLSPGLQLANNNPKGPNLELSASVKIDGLSADVSSATASTNSTICLPNPDIGVGMSSDDFSFSDVDNTSSAHLSEFNISSGDKSKNSQLHQVKSLVSSHPSLPQGLSTSCAATIISSIPTSPSSSSYSPPSQTPLNQVTNRAVSMASFPFSDTPPFSSPIMGGTVPSILTTTTITPFVVSDNRIIDLASKPSCSDVSNMGPAGSTSIRELHFGQMDSRPPDMDTISLHSPKGAEVNFLTSR
ncbi:unnamed protein product [Protopolystoma xenopodis]|uniref:Uncharacterized protein n=1 Tax=Protopolystoma xenopodis TaxID=117903 RepID=A0A3S5B3T7_9PLAT|nr:unnamed protein product [Protopolystoma xenopodis]